MTDKNEPGTFNWDHAIYWAEISASELPDRAKNLLRLLFDKFKQQRKEQLEMSVAEAVKGLYDHLGIQTQESSVRRALTNLTACKILEVRQHNGRRSTWVLKPRELWKLTCPSGESQVGRIDRRLRELDEERRGLLRLRCELTQTPGEPPLPPRSTTPSNHVQPRSTTFNLPTPEDEMPQTQNRLSFNGDPEAPPPPRSTTFNRLHMHSMHASLEDSSKASIALHASGGARGGWGVSLTSEEVRDVTKGREIFLRCVRADLLVDDPDTELHFYAFLCLAGHLDRTKQIKKSREAFIATAIRKGFWRERIDAYPQKAVMLSKGADMLESFKVKERLEAATAWSSEMPGLDEWGGAL